ncbi:helix-turn-helix domain-containing protein, partial [Myxococcota bacterium]|nr:helix-turn-helix domain-containing protein [Myxococcota bacterium]
DLVAELYATPMNDGPMADELNRRGVPSGTGRPWESEGVEKLRDELGLPGLHLPPPASPPPERREDGLYSVRGVAKATGANQETIRRWVRAGLLVPKEGGGHGCTMWFDIPDEQLTALTKRRNSAAHGRKRRV